MTVDVGFLTYK